MTTRYQWLAPSPPPSSIDLKAAFWPSIVDAVEQLCARLVVERAEHAHRVLALDAETRMHQLVRQVARVREQQQALGVDVEATDRLPLALLQARQAAEHGRTLLRIVVA